MPTYLRSGSRSGTQQSLPRIFQLLPSPEGTISIHLFEIDLADEVEYECISYTWGEDTTTAPITVNGIQHETRCNLWNGIRRLQDENPSRRLWADAISINQNDLIEKGWQVSIIGEIFKKAIRVCIWLGEHADGSEEYFAAIPKLRQVYLPTMTRLYRKLFGVGYARNRPVERFILRHRSNRTRSLIRLHLEEFIAMCERPYWRRIWIKQEMLLARKSRLYCGNSAVKYRHFADANLAVVKYCLAHGLFTNAMWQAIPMERTMGVEVAFELFEVCLAAHCTSDATDTRDMIYALLPLRSRSHDPSPIHVDYTIEAMELYFRCLQSFKTANKPILIKTLSLALRLEPREILESFNRDPSLFQRCGLTRREWGYFFENETLAGLRTEYDSAMKGSLW